MFQVRVLLPMVLACLLAIVAVVLLAAVSRQYRRSRSSRPAHGEGEGESPNFEPLTSDLQRLPSNNLQFERGARSE